MPCSRQLLLVGAQAQLGPLAGRACSTCWLPLGSLEHGRPAYTPPACPPWLQVRTKLVGHTEAFYSDYTCYTGIADFTPPDIDVGGCTAVVAALSGIFGGPEEAGRDEGE